MFSRVGRLSALVATFIAVGVLGGCAKSAQPIATGKGDIRGINAVVSAPEIGFLIEETGLGGMDYKATSGFGKYDDLTYNFNFDMFMPGEAGAIRVATHVLKVVADQRHTVVLTGTIANPVTLDWEDPARSWDDSETVTEVIFAHIAPNVDELDFYFAPTGTPPMAGQDVGSLSSGNRLEAMDFESDEYELILTPKGDPATVLFQSIPLATAPRTNVTIAVFDPDPSITSDLAVNLITIDGISSSIPDVNFRGQLRLMHGAFGIENFDGFLADNFNDIVYPDIGFQELSAYAETPQFLTPVTLTPVGNIGATIHEEDVSIARILKRTAILGGTLAEPFFFVTVDEARPLETFPVLRVINLSINVDAVHIYVLDAGTLIEDVLFPTIPALPAGFDSGYRGTGNGQQEITITAIGDSTPIAIPLELKLAKGDVIDLVILDTVDPDVLELVLFDRQ